METLKKDRPLARSHFVVYFAVLSPHSSIVPTPEWVLHSMWWPCLLLALIAIHLKASNGSAGAEPSGGGRYRHLSDGLPLRVLSQQAAEAGRVVGEEIQQRLEPLER